MNLNFCHFATENEKLTKQELTDLLVGHGESLKALKALTRPKLVF